ncbi:predicted protein [Postia placenta Mad-698-R]|nr:predicted protein [Postia placenta Mad-698-R]
MLPKRALKAVAKCRLICEGGHYSLNTKLHGYELGKVWSGPWGGAGEDITNDEGDGGLPAGGDGCCDCPPGELREERMLEWPRGGDGGGGDGGSPVAGLHTTGTGVEEGTADDELAQEYDGVSRGSALGGAWRGRSGWDGSNMARGGSRGASVSKGWAAGVLDSSDWHVAPFVGSDGPRSTIRARLSVTDEEGSSIPIAFGVVVGDVDLLLGVEGVLDSRAVKEFVSHGDGGRKGSMQQEPSPRIREDKYRPLKCSKGRENLEDLLVLHLGRRRQFEEVGSWGRQGANAARRSGMQGCFGDRAGVEPV